MTRVALHICVLCIVLDGCSESTNQLQTPDASVSCSKQAAELCDGIDNDCNPATQDGADEIGQACDGEDADLCAEGVRSCTNGVLRCMEDPASELDLCDGLDNDCNPSTQDGSGEATLGAACDGNDSDSCEDDHIACTNAMLGCSSDGVANTEGPTFSVTCSDAIDNDCDGATDLEDSECRQWVITPITYQDFALRASHLFIDSEDTMRLVALGERPTDQKYMVVLYATVRSGVVDTFEEVNALDPPFILTDLIGAAFDRTANRTLLAYSRRNSDTSTAGSLVFSSRTTSWSHVTVSEPVATHVDLAEAPNGTLYAAYYDAASTAQDLRVAISKNNGSTWSDVAVDTTGIVGKYPSVAVDHQNRVHITYWDQTQGDLKHAFSIDAGSTWTRETVDSANFTGEYSSLVIDDANQLHVAYYEGSGQNLRYIHTSSSGWSASEIVDTSSDVGKYAKLLLDRNGRPRIAYYDAVARRLKMARSSDAIGTTWTSEVPEDAGYLNGQYSTFGWDSKGVLHIVYGYREHETNRAILHYARIPD